MDVSVCEDGGVPRLRRTGSAVGLAFAAYDVWLRLAAAAPGPSHARKAVRPADRSPDGQSRRTRRRPARGRTSGYPSAWRAIRSCCGGARSDTPRWGSRAGAADVAKRNAGRQRLLQAVPDRAPRAMFCGPPAPRRPRPDPGRKRRARELGLREGIQLLGTADGDFPASARSCARRCRSRPCPSRGRAGACTIGAGVADHRLERAIGQVGERRGCLAEAEQALRRHHHQRARHGSRPAAEEMEELRGGGRVDDPDVVLRGRLRKRSSLALECSGPFPS
jgi:hypothetical protein